MDPLNVDLASASPDFASINQLCKLVYTELRGKLLATLAHMLKIFDNRIVSN